MLRKRMFGLDRAEPFAEEDPPEARLENHCQESSAENLAVGLKVQHLTPFAAVT